MNPRNLRNDLNPKRSQILLVGGPEVSWSGPVHNCFWLLAPDPKGLGSSVRARDYIDGLAVVVVVVVLVVVVVEEDVVVDVVVAAVAAETGTAEPIIVVMPAQPSA